MDLLGAVADLSSIEGRLRSLQRLCAVLVLVALACSVVCWGVAFRARGESPAGVPEGLPAVLALVAAAFILLSSRLRSTLLRRALPRTEGLRLSLEGLLPAYRSATLASFGLLAVAALVGPAVAWASGRAQYGLIVCAASSFAMLTRWPKATEVDRILRGRVKP